MEIFDNFKDLFLSVWNRGILGIDIFEILIGLGIGEGTEHVSKYYRNSHANIPVDEITSKISEIIQDLIIG